MTFVWVGAFKEAAMQRAELIELLTSDTLEIVAPEEALLVASCDPDSRLAGIVGRGPQGLGVETAITLLLPAIYANFR